MKSISLTRPVQVNFGEAYQREVDAVPLKGLFRGAARPSPQKFSPPPKPLGES